MMIRPEKKVLIATNAQRVVEELYSRCGNFWILESKFHDVIKCVSVKQDYMYNNESSKLVMKFSQFM